MLEIVEYGDPVLRERARPVKQVTVRIRVLAERMLKTMKAAHGIGLAAPQVGIPRRLLVASLDHRDYVLINPEIVSMEGQQVDIEGCLSFPSLQGEVSRAQRIVIRALDRYGKPFEMSAEGLLARVFQHEYDHLNGVLFIDKVDPRTLHWMVAEEPAAEDSEEQVQWRKVMTTLEEVDRVFRERRRRVAEQRRKMDLQPA
jgi:peptide deformylase